MGRFLVERSHFKITRFDRGAVQDMMTRVVTSNERRL